MSAKSEAQEIAESYDQVAVQETGGGRFDVYVEPDHGQYWATLRRPVLAELKKLGVEVFDRQTGARL
jgi:hypothetical protein